MCIRDRPRTDRHGGYLWQRLRLRQAPEEEEEQDSAVHQLTELARWLSFWLTRHLTLYLLTPELLCADTMNSYYYQ